MKKILLFLVVFLLTLSPLKAADEGKEEMDFNEVGGVVIQTKGSHKPFDTYARYLLLSLHSKSKFKDVVTGEKMSAVEWLCEVMFDVQKSNTRKVFKVRNDQVMRSIDLPVDKKNRLYSFDDLAPALGSFSERWGKLSEKEEKYWNATEKGFVKLYGAISQFTQMQQAFLAFVDRIEILDADIAASTLR